MGMITYLGKFLPYLSSILAQLRQLLPEDVKWSWTDQHDLAVDNLAENAFVIAFHSRSTFTGTHLRTRSCNARNKIEYHRKISYVDSKYRDC